VLMLSPISKSKASMAYRQSRRRTSSSVQGWRLSLADTETVFDPAITMANCIDLAPALAHTHGRDHGIYVARVRVHTCIRTHGDGMNTSIITTTDSTKPLTSVLKQRPSLAEMHVKYLAPLDRSVRRTT
jgi:hypothetical protein